MLIALAGIDGAGKSTQCRHLEQWLVSKSIPVKVIDKWDILDSKRFPECRFIQPDLDQLRVCIAHMEGASRALFLIWAIAAVMKRYEQDPGQVYLLDGYWMKHLASEILYGNEEAWLLGLVSVLPSADKILYFDVDVSRTRVRKQVFTPYECGRNDVSEQAFDMHQLALKGLMDRWADNMGWTIIDANQPESSVRAALQEVLAPLLRVRP
jgi:thymidylate kinase